MTTTYPTAQQQLVEDCQGLVRSLALSVHRKLPPAVDLDDLIAYGQVGLSEAARDFDPSRGSRFSTYAYYRIRGAIYDGLSKMTWFGRANYHHTRYEQMSNEVLRLEGEEAKPAQDNDSQSDARWLRGVSRALAVVYLAARAGSRGEQEEGMEASLADPASPEGSADLMERELAERLHALVDALPPTARDLIQATYFEGVTLQEAGKRLGVSKSWASRLHARALEQLARAMRQEGLGG